MIVVDSSVWISNLRKHLTAPVLLLFAVAGREPLVVGDLVMLEVLKGARDEMHAARIERNLRRHIVQPMVNDGIVVQASRNYRTLRENGITVRKTSDLLIGTFCIEMGHRLLHDDLNFDAMESVLGLSVVR